jgi:hypothetical protein
MSKLMYSKIVPKLSALEIQEAKIKLMEENKDMIDFGVPKSSNKRLVYINRENVIEKAVCMYLNRDYSFINPITKVNIYEN